MSSINIKRFNESDPEELEAESNPVQVLKFLRENDDRARKAMMIAEHTDVSKNSIGAVLVRLEDRLLVRHKGPYWAITDDEQRVVGYDRYALSTRSLNDSLGEENPDD